MLLQVLIGDSVALSTIVDIVHKRRIDIFLMNVFHLDMLSPLLLGLNCV